MRLGGFIYRFKHITYDTGALQSAEEVLQLVKYTKDRTWTSETGDWNYNSTPKQYQQDYPEFSGMNEAQMQTPWSNNSSRDYSQWAHII